MLIKSLQLQNFRQYKGVQQFDFATDPEKNVTVITGVNTGGKTTIVQSFIWCLYGKNSFKKGTLLNLEVESELKEKKVGSRETVQVQVVLVYKGTEYIFNRSKEYTLRKRDASGTSIDSKNPSFEVFYKDTFGRAKQYTKDPVDLINEILPENLSEYFFFWGERIENLGEKKNISGAVKEFMGLDVLEKARNYLKTAANTFRVDPKTEANADKMILQFATAIEKAKKELERNEFSLEGAQASFEMAEKIYQEASEQLLSHNIQAVSAAQTKRNQNNANLQRFRNDLENAKKRYSKDFADNAVAFYSQHVAEAAVNLLNEDGEEFTTFSGITVKTIQEILSQKKCICGNEFCEGDHTYQELMRIMKLVPPNRIDNAIRGYKSYISGQKSSRNRYLVTLKRDMDEIGRLELLIEGLEEDNVKQQKIIDDEPLAEQIETKSKTAYKTMMDAKGKVAKYEAEKTRLNNEIETNQQKWNKYDREKNSNLERVKYRTYAQAAADLIDQEYTTGVKKIQEQLQEYVTEYFDEMYSGKRTVKIDTDYTMHLFVGNDETPTSPGLETVKNFAFVAGLVEMAKKKAAEEGDAATTEPYPLVLDAPFSQTDENHVPAIARLVSKVAEQTIIVVMKKDWAYAEDIMKDKVGAFYTLEKVSEHHTRHVRKDGEE